LLSPPPHASRTRDVRFRPSLVGVVSQRNAGCRFTLMNADFRTGAARLGGDCCCEFLSGDSMTWDPVTYKHQELTQLILGVFYEVYNELGHGFLESLYHEATLVALRQ